MTRLGGSVAMLALGGALVGAALVRDAASGAHQRVREGGTFRIAYTGIDGIDPALTFDSALLNASCAHLMNYPDRPPPAGFRLEPEAAVATPRVSRDGRTYRFTIRRGLRFSNGARLTVRNFARAFERAFAPSMQSPGAFFLEDVVGAAEVREGRLPRGILARGRTLTIRLTRRVPDFPARMATLPFCAVPPNLPIDPEGVGAPLHLAGPYYVAEYVPGRRVVLRRNRYYRGTRPHHVDTFIADLRAASDEDIVDRIRRGTAHWGFPRDEALFEQASELRRRRSRFFVQPGLVLQGFYLNTRRPLFRNNARLRRAVNFAVDRPALVRQFGGPLSGRPTDQYLPPSFPAFRDARIYPLHRPNARRARALARRHLRGGKAVLYTPSDAISVAQAQTVKRNLAAIGLEVEVKEWPRRVHFQKLSTRGEPWDLAAWNWVPEYADPYSYLNELFAGTSPPFDPFARAPRYRRLLARAALLRGAARHRAYGALDVRLARDAAPFVATFYGAAPTLVSRRVDPRCVVLRPYLDLAAVCLRR
jgi:peptide/nickel transport system substrate-binding protein